MNILIVDDDHEDAELLHEAIKDSSPKAVCRVAPTAQAALDLTRDFAPHIVFLDAVMHPVGGRDILQQLVSLPSLRTTRFVIISGLLLPAHHEDFISRGASLIMTKPPTYQALLQFVRQVITASEVSIKAKVYTNHDIVHEQISSLQDLLDREIHFEISLNGQPARQNIQFLASEIELRKIKSELGYNLLLLSGGHWLPNI